MSRFDYDVVILGSGLGGGLLAVVCRALGLRVLLVEKGDHPRFAIGESVTGEALRRLDYLAARYDSPVLSQLSSYWRIKKAGVPVATWPKAHFLIEQHQPGRRVDPNRPAEILVQASVWPLGPDAHVYRPELDLFVKDKAVEEGAEYLANTAAVAYEFDDESGSSIELQTAGESPRRVTCRLLVDATGPARWLARHLGLDRIDSEVVPMASGAVFAHFRGIKSLDDVLGAKKLLFPRDHGTLLHVGEHGMLWVIPFDNGLTSIGWVTSEELPAGEDPEALFWKTVQGCPTVADQLAGAEATTPYFRLDRLQYSTERVADDGWFLLPASAEFSDPLYSVGIPLTLAAITRLARCLEDADPDRPLLRRDMAWLEDRFRLESEYIRKFTIATKKAFVNYDVLNRVVNVNRLVIFREGAYIGSKTQVEAACAPAWGVADEGIRRIIDAVYEYVLSIDFSAPVTDETLRRFDEIIEPLDAADFLKTSFGRLRDEDAIYFASIPRLLHFFWRAKEQPLGLSKLGGLRQVGQRWVQSFTTLNRDTGENPQPVIRGVLRDQLRSLFQP